MRRRRPRFVRSFYLARCFRRRNRLRDSIFRLPAIAMGMGFAAHCTVLAHRIPRTPGRHYDRAVISRAPDALPDGEYLVLFDDHIMRCQKNAGTWIASFDLGFTSYCPGLAFTRDYP